MPLLKRNWVFKGSLDFMANKNTVTQPKGFATVFLWSIRKAAD